MQSVFTLEDTCCQVGLGTTQVMCELDGNSERVHRLGSFGGATGTALVALQVNFKHVLCLHPANPIQIIAVLHVICLPCVACFCT